MSALAHKIRQAFRMGGGTLGVVGAASVGSPRSVGLSAARVASPLTRCTLPTPYAATVNDEVVHPSVIHVPGGWNGYEYWMAYTPYPNTNDQYENPCIAASNDRVNWVLPPGAPNPVVANQFANGHLSDADICIGPGNVLYMIYRWKDRTAGTEGFALTTTGDGSNWSAPVTLTSGPTASKAYLSPSAIWTGTNWEVYAVDSSTAGRPVIRWVLNNLTDTWPAPTTVTAVLPGTQAWWHPCVRLLPDGTRVMLAQTDVGAGALYWGVSTDGGATFGVRAVQRAGVGYQWYRSSFVVRYGTNGAPSLELWLCREGSVNALDDWRIYYAEGAFDGDDFAKARRSMIASLLGSAAAGPSSLLFADTFNRADNAAAIGSPLFGPAYAVLAGTFGIESNRLRQAADGNGRLSIELGTSDYEVSVTAAAFSANSEFWLWGRQSDINNGWRFGYRKTQTGLRLQRIVAGQISGGDYEIAATLVPGDEIALAFDGANVVAKVNGRVVATVTSNYNMTVTKAGLQALQADVRWDDLVAWRAV